MKTILSTVAVATLIAFSGCSAVTDNPIANVAKSATNAVTDSASGAADIATGKTSLKDMAVDKAVGAADEKTDGAASKVIDAVK